MAARYFYFFLAIYLSSLPTLQAESRQLSEKNKSADQVQSKLNSTDAPQIPTSLEQARQMVKNEKQSAYEKQCQVWIKQKDRMPEAKRALGIYDFQWTYWMRTFPEWATSTGFEGQNNRWSDRSFLALARQEREERCYFRMARSLDLNKLSGEARFNAELFQFDAHDREAGTEFMSEYLGLNQLSGPHQIGPRLFQTAPKAGLKDVQDILLRLKAADRLIEQEMALLNEGIGKKVTAPKVVLEKVPEQIAAMIKDNPFESPWLRFLEDLPKSLTDEQAQAFKTEASQIYSEKLKPKLLQFQKFVTEVYIPAARDTIAWKDLPNGAKWYAQRLRSVTTSSDSPAQIHQVGLREVERIEKEIKKIGEELQIKGQIVDVAKTLLSDKRYIFTDKETFLAHYRDIAKRADVELPKFFTRLPRLPYGVTSVPEYAEKTSPAAYYEEGSLETGRPGLFFANTYNLSNHPRWEMESLCLHESVPGHHLQIALAQEQESVPRFRQHSGYTAFSEGWGLYAETLGYEMGFYKSPAERFGQLTNEMWRAVRLVVDTGLHHFGWTRQQSIQYMMEKTGKGQHEAEVEINRYIVWAGQATAYKLGQLKIKDLRERSQKALGEKFNIRKFHDVVLAHGALPLEILDRQIAKLVVDQKNLRIRESH